MKPTFFLAGALTLALVPGAILLPGCGGGNGSSGASTPNLRFSRQSNLEFPDAPQITGILTVNFADDNPANNARAAGTLQLFRTPMGAPTPQPFPASSDGSDGEEFFAVLPADATYILVGDVVPGSGAGADIAVDLRGSYEDRPRFTLRGNFVEGATISLEARFERGDSVLRGRVINVNNVAVPNRPTPTPSVTATVTATPTVAPTTNTTAGTTGSTTVGTTAGNTTAGNTTAGATTAGATTAGATTAGATTAGATTAGAGTAGSTTAGAITAGSTLGGGGTTDPPMLP